MVAPLTDGSSNAPRDDSNIVYLKDLIAGSAARSPQCESLKGEPLPPAVSEPEVEDSRDGAGHPLAGAGHPPAGAGHGATDGGSPSAHEVHEDDVPIARHIDFLATLFATAYSEVDADLEMEKDVGEGADEFLELDGSLASVVALDRVMQRQADRLAAYDELPSRGSPERQAMEEMVQGAGAYFGKLVVEHIGGAWVQGEDGHLHIVGLSDLSLQPFQVATDALCRCEDAGCTFTALVTGLCDILGVKRPHLDCGG